MNNDSFRSSMLSSFKRVSSANVLYLQNSLSDTDVSIINSLGFKSDPTENKQIDIEEAKQLLESVCSSYSRSKFDNYLSEAENKVFEAIIKPFGLAKVIFDGKDEKFNPNDYRSSRFKNEADKMKHDNTVNVDVLVQ